MSQESVNLLKQINLRRATLRMSTPALARRSGVSTSTIQRILYGDLENTSFANIQAVLNALGLTIDCRPKIDIQRFREEQARSKAKKIVRMVQSTAGLESQAVDEAAMEQMVNQTVHELLAGSPRKLWAE